MLVCLLAVLSISGCIRKHEYTLKINGYSMAPALEDEQIIFADPVELKELQRGDIIYFSDPLTTNTLIKRLIGLPGEVVEINDGLIYIDGVQLEESYTTSSPTYQYGPITLGADEYFVLGDNRNSSYDSHMWGALPGKYIKARIVLK
jgi:signal peptidase I